VDSTTRIFSLDTAPLLLPIRVLLTECAQLSLQLRHEENKGAESLTSDSIPLEIAPEDIEFGEFIGEGVYSEVYKGYCYGTPVAIKKFKNQGFDGDTLKEVRKEVRIMK
jgi:hypothetical protein